MQGSQGPSSSYYLYKISVRLDQAPLTSTRYADWHDSFTVQRSGAPLLSTDLTPNAQHLASRSHSGQPL